MRAFFLFTGLRKIWKEDLNWLWKISRATLEARDVDSTFQEEASVCVDGGIAQERQGGLWMQGHMGDIRQCSVAEMLGIQRRRHAGIMVGGHFSRWFRLGTTCDRDKRFSKMRQMDKHKRWKKQFSMVLILVSDFSFLCTRKATFPVPLLLGKLRRIVRPIYCKQKFNVLLLGWGSEKPLCYFSSVSLPLSWKPRGPSVDMRNRKIMAAWIRESPYQRQLP